MQDLNMDPQTLKQILSLVFKFTGITMNEKKRDMIKIRLNGRMRALGFTDYSQYVEHLKKTKEEVQEFINLITTNETYFFRTQKVWDYFSDSFLPAWYKNNPKTNLRVWSAASSSGEEAYTMAICCEEFSLQHPQFSYQIHATDISTDVLKVAKAGVFHGRSVTRLQMSHPNFLEKYFLKNGDSFTVIPRLREKISFDTYNLLDLPKRESSFDIVFLRNVLIYFEALEQEKILANVSKSLVGDGTIIIGESESLRRLNTSFQFNSPMVYDNRKCSCE